MNSITKRIVSGIQPSGILHLGNYIGAVQSWLSLQKDKNNKCFYFIADNHSITTESLFNNTDININLKNNTLTTAALLLACGVDPKETTFFVQSSISHHSELMWLLSCITPLSWLNTMIQFKEKNKKKDNSNAGLYTYPILMAADILLYKADLVPVGIDQVQHIQLARDIAERLNKLANHNVTQIPSYMLSPNDKVMSLQNASAKMSKSDKNTHSCISLLDSNDDIINKVKKAKTDSLGKITYDKETRPELANLLRIYSSIENITVNDCVMKFENASTYEFKQELSKAVIRVIEPIAYKSKILIEKEQYYIRDVLNEGKKKAKIEAEQNLNEIKAKLKYLI